MAKFIHYPHLPRCSAIRYKNSKLSNYFFPHCLNLIDQTNCTDPARVGGICTNNGYPTTVSKYVMCHGEGQFLGNTNICDDHMEDRCETLSYSCSRIHKHMMCNGVFDCDNGADEDATVCNEQTNKTCVRRFGGTKVALPVPLSWLTDGDIDCLDGEDEVRGNWRSCGAGATSRYASSNAANCTEVFICKDKGLIRLTELCDKISSCEEELQMCRISRYHPNMALFSQPTQKERLDNDTVLRVSLSYCLKGLEDVELKRGACLSQTFNLLNNETLGKNSSITLVLPGTRSEDCASFYGENYLFMSCTDKCPNVRCPIKDHVMTQDMCTNLDNRVFTLVNNSYLTFLVRQPVRSANLIYHNNFFSCANRNCVPYDKVCNNQNPDL